MRGRNFEQFPTPLVVGPRTEDTETRRLFGGRPGKISRRGAEGAEEFFAACGDARTEGLAEARRLDKYRKRAARALRKSGGETKKEAVSK